MEDTLDKILKLLHPFMPFITEEIWHHLPESGLSLLTESWPEANRRWLDEEAEETMRFLQALISEIRTIRAENQLPVKEKVNLWISEGKKSHSLSGPPEEAIRQLAGVDKIEYVTEMPAANNLLRGGGMEQPKSGCSWPGPLTALRKSSGCRKSWPVSKKI